MAESTARLMTVAEYEQIPEGSGAFYYELHHGELVKVSSESEAYETSTATAAVIGASSRRHRNRGN